MVYLLEIQQNTQLPIFNKKVLSMMKKYYLRLSSVTFQTIVGLLTSYKGILLLETLMLVFLVKLNQ